MRHDGKFIRDTWWHVQKTWPVAWLLTSQSRRIPFFPDAPTHVSISTTSPLQAESAIWTFELWLGFMLEITPAYSWKLIYQLRKLCIVFWSIIYNKDKQFGVCFKKYLFMFVNLKNEANSNLSWDFTFKQVELKYNDLFARE